MEVTIGSDGVQMRLAGDDGWRPCEAGIVLAASPTFEFLIPATDVVSVGDVVRANVEGLVCTYDLAVYDLATIAEQGHFFEVTHRGHRLLLRRTPLGR